MPTFAVQDNWESSDTIIDHWRALQLDRVTEQFDLKHKHDLLRTFLTHTEPHAAQTLCVGARCHNGILYGEGCTPIHSRGERAHDGRRNPKCAMVLSSYPGQYSVGLEHLKYTRKKWLAYVFKLNLDNVYS